MTVYLASYDSYCFEVPCILWWCTGTYATHLGMCIKPLDTDNLLQYNDNLRARLKIAISIPNESTLITVLAITIIQG